MSKRFLVIGVVLLLAGAIVSTAAAQSNDQAVDGIYLSPANTDNGDTYASINSQGELRVEASNLNARAVITIDSVFTITSNQTDAARVWVEPPSGDITFYRMDTGATITSESQAMSLDDGETVTVGMRVDTRNGSPQDGTVTLHALLPEESTGQSARGGDMAPQVPPSTPGTATDGPGSSTPEPPSDDGSPPSDPGSATPEGPTQTDATPESEVGGFPWQPLLGLAALLLVPLGLFLWRRRQPTGLRFEVADESGLAVSPGSFADATYDVSDEAITFDFRETDQWSTADGAAVVTLDAVAHLENATASPVTVRAVPIGETVEGAVIRAGATTDLLTNSVSIGAGESVTLSAEIPADIDVRSFAVRCVTAD